MTRVQIHYTVDPHHLDAVKKAASKHLAEISPSLRMEILSRALGFNTWAAMKVSKVTRQELNVDAALAFAGSREVAINPLSLHLTMAEATLLRVAKQYPELHLHGVHEGYFTPSGEQKSAIKAAALAGTFFEEMHKYRRSGFEESRVDLLDSNQAEQTLRAMALFSSLTPTKTVGQRSRSSYGIKHVAERMTFDLGDGVILAPGYVSNVDAIIAALDRDFKVKHHGGNSPNVDIGISVASLRAAQAEQKPNKLLA
jgi:hypothetical protein